MSKISKSPNRFFTVHYDGRDYVSFVVSFCSSFDPSIILVPFFLNKARLSFREISFNDFMNIDLHHFYKFRVGAFSFELSSKSVLRLSKILSQFGIQHLDFYGSY